MTKIDMADHAATTGWEVFFKERGLTMLALDLFDNKSPDIILAAALEMNKALHQRQIAKGMKPQPIRAMVIGIPNVGKSTLINRLSSRQATVVSDRPGVTRAPQWIKPNNKIWLLDTPGVLPMNYEIPLMSLHLASIGAIKRDILPLDTIGKFLFDYIKRNYPRLLDRYVDHQVAPSYESFLILVANRFGLLDQGVPDIDKAIARFYDDFKSGKIGRISLEVAF
jgi:ribosome biogenesis GTPase A